MSAINLKFEIYIQEDCEQGLIAVRDILSHSEVRELGVFDAGATYLCQRNDLESPSTKFNILEGRGKSLEFRYRPAVSSRIWTELSLPSVDDIPHIKSEEDKHKYQLFLSLVSFEHASRHRNATRVGVVQILALGVPQSDTPEDTISDTVETMFPSIFEMNAWGYVDVVPFRNLTVDEEWKSARSSLMECQLERTALIPHLYLISAPGITPLVPVSETVFRNKKLRIYRIASEAR